MTTTYTPGSEDLDAIRDLMSDAQMAGDDVTAAVCAILIDADALGDTELADLCRTALGPITVEDGISLYEADDAATRRVEQYIEDLVRAYVDSGYYVYQDEESGGVIRCASYEEAAEAHSTGGGWGATVIDGRSVYVL